MEANFDLTVKSVNCINNVFNLAMLKWIWDAQLTDDVYLMSSIATTKF
jgi:hypothetical protein